VQRPALRAQRCPPRYPRWPLRARPAGQGFLVDTLGLLLHAIVHPADIQDRDGGYQGPEFQKALTRILPQLKTDIIKRSDQAKGFVVLPRRWIVEQSNEPSLGFNRCRRLAKDWENLNRKALALPVRRNCSLDPDARIALHPLHQQVER
jgi:transposase